MQIFKGIVTLKKFPGKGGWTYSPLPPIGHQQNLPFNWIIVDGNIDHVTLKK